MKTIEITTEVMPWANDMPHTLGAVVETDDEIADTIIANGHAKLVAKRRKAAADVAPEALPEQAPEAPNADV